MDLSIYLSSNWSLLCIRSRDAEGGALSFAQDEWRGYVDVSEDCVFSKNAQSDADPLLRYTNHHLVEERVFEVRYETVAERHSLAVCNPVDRSVSRQS